ncbi:MAG: cupin domain-containing protein [Eubacteriales bacterium]|nr:cupin domain-containing protein [Eubacteriales bacterium]
MIIRGIEDAPYVLDKYPHERVRRVFLSPELDPEITDFACGMSEVPPGSQSDLHVHEGSEMWFCISGRGHIIIGDEVEELRPNMAVWSPGNCKHQLKNDIPGEKEKFVLLFFLLPPGKEKEIVKEWRQNNPKGR